MQPVQQSNAKVTAYEHMFEMLNLLIKNMKKYVPKFKCLANCRLRKKLKIAQTCTHTPNCSKHTSLL